MAAQGPPQQNPPSSSVLAPQQPQIPTNPDQVSWDGDKMFNIYILDYCKKRGYRKTANELVIEADISPDSKPPINAQQGLLFEWWSVFWVLFQAKNNGAGSEDAMLYHKHQSLLKSRAGQAPPPGVPQSSRYLLNGGVPGPVPPLPAAHMNGIGPGGQPQSLSAPPPYGPANPGGQPNGIPGPAPAPPGAPGQPFPGGMPGRPPLGPQQRLPNGPQYRSPTIAPSPQAQGNPPQPPGGAMAQLGRSPHMSTVNRAAMPPPNGPQHPQGPGSTGSPHPTPTLSYQQPGRPPSSHGVSSHNPMNPHQSPAMGAGRIPPGQGRSHMDSALDNELSSYPIDVINDAKRHAGLGDRDPQSLTTDEKQNILHHAARLRQNPPNGGMAGPSGVNPHVQMQNRGPMPQPMQAQLSMPQRGKRNSTSPGEQHPTLPRNDQSPPDRKRPRRTPIPAEQQQQQPQLQQQQQQQPQQSQPQPQPPTSQQPQQTPQPPPPQQQQQQQQQQPQQPPMAPMGPLPPGPQPGSRGALPMAGQPHPNGFGGPPMHQMVGPGPMTPMHAMSPGMGHGPPMGVINPQQMVQSQVLYQGQYRPGMVNPQVNAHKGNPNVPVHALGPGHGPGPMPNRLSGPLVPTQSGQPPKGMGPMPPPGMSGPPKPGGKEGEGELNTPLNPAASAPTPGPLHNNAPPMNPQRPPTANAPMSTPAPPPPAPGPGPMGDLSFDMTDMFGSNGDFTFGTNPLADMELWFDSPGVHDSSIDMK